MNSKFHAFMYPRFAFGHMTPYLHLANKLAEKGNRITFLLPKKAQKLLEHLSLFPQHIVFHPLTIPHVDGLPPGAQTASDITVSLDKFLTKPWTSHEIRSKLRFSFETRPGFLRFRLLGSRDGQSIKSEKCVSSCGICVFNSLFTCPQC